MIFGVVLLELLIPFILCNDKISSSNKVGFSALLVVGALVVGGLKFLLG